MYALFVYFIFYSSALTFLLISLDLFLFQFF